MRLYTWDNTQALDDAFWRERLEDGRAPAQRRSGSTTRDGAARLVFSEADGLSGLIVDRYADWLAMQVTALAMARAARRDSSTILVELTGAAAACSSAPKKAWPAPKGSSCATGCIWGKAPDGPAFIVENGLRYGVDLAEGQKTGFYLDQRDNRRGGRPLLCAIAACSTCSATAAASP